MHEHAHGHPRDGGALGALRIALLLTGALLVLQVVGGFLSKSLALLADAAHLLTDLGGLALAYTAALLAQRPATRKRTYGLYRVEILAALANGVVLLLLSGFIVFEAIQRLRQPTPLDARWMLGVALVSLVGNFVSLSVLRTRHRGSLNLKAAYLEVLADTLGAAGVAVASIVILATGFTAVDPALSVLLAIAIVPRTLKLLHEALHVLLEGTPPGLDHEAIEAELQSIDGVTAVHDLHVWALTSGVPVLTAHVVAGDPACDDLLDRVTTRLKEEFGIEHVTIQIEHVDRERREDHGF